MSRGEEVKGKHSFKKIRENKFLLPKKEF